MTFEDIREEFDGPSKASTRDQVLRLNRFISLRKERLVRTRSDRNS